MAIESSPNRKLYHITHISNLSSIIQAGGILSGTELRRAGVHATNIGHTTLKESRAKKVVPVDPGGTLEDYVPLFFSTRPPMIIVISKGAVEGYDGPQEEVIYLVSSISTITQTSCRWCFTDGHAREEITVFLNELEALDCIDWGVIGHWDYRPTLSDPDRKRKKQAEFLVHGCLPWECIETIGVMSEKMRGPVQEILNASSSHHIPNINIQANWYHNKKEG